MSRTILHVDMDAFFASVEQRDDPSLRGRPVLVAGAPPRGVVAAASYEARPSGARSAMPIVEALRRCPDAVLVKPRHAHYREVSQQVFAIFARFTPEIEALSLDEAFLDVTASRALFGDGAAIARAIRAAVRAEVGLACSAGIAANKFVAKLASDLAKPDGLHEITAEHAASELSPLPIGRMWGVGAQTETRLRALGIKTFGDLAAADPGLIETSFGEWGQERQRLARGIDERPVVSTREAKSVGAEETFDEDLTERAALEYALLEQAQRVARRLVRRGLCAGTVVLKIKLADFTLITRRCALAEPVADTQSIHRAVCALLDRVDLAGLGVRLTGVSVTELRRGPPPRVLFPEAGKAQREKLESVLDAVSARFGGHGIQRATLLRSRSRT